MALREYQEEFRTTYGKMHAVICIDQAFGMRRKSPINEMLEEVQLRLKDELDRYKEIQVSFVYETPLLDVKPFEKLTTDTPLYYKEECEGSSHSLHHLMAMALAVLDQGKAEGAENRLYLLTDENFASTDIYDILGSGRKPVLFNNRFSDMNFTPYLYTNQNFAKRERNALEKYFGEHIRVLTR